MASLTRSLSLTKNCWLCVLLLAPVTSGISSNSISVADAQLDAAFYSDASCLLTIDTFVQSGKTLIDADVDAEGSRMLIHCDTEDGRRLTILARGDALSMAQRAPLLSRAEIAEGEFGMIAWLTRSGAHYTDDTAPRRYVIGGSVKLRKSPPLDVDGSALNSNRQSFASINGVLEPIIKSDGQNLQRKLIDSASTTDGPSKTDEQVPEVGPNTQKPATGAATEDTSGDQPNTDSGDTVTSSSTTE